MADESLTMAPSEPPQKPVPVKAGSGEVVPAGGDNWWVSFKNYLAETQAEVKKVTWPSNEEWVNSSIITLLTILALALVMEGYNLVARYLAGAIFGTG